MAKRLESLFDIAGQRKRAELRAKFGSSAEAPGMAQSRDLGMGDIAMSRLKDKFSEMSDAGSRILDEGLAPETTEALTSLRPKTRSNAMGQGLLAGVAGGLGMRPRRIANEKAEKEQSRKAGIEERTTAADELRAKASMEAAKRGPGGKGRRIVSVKINEEMAAAGLGELGETRQFDEDNLASVMNSSLGPAQRRDAASERAGLTDWEQNRRNMEAIASSMEKQGKIREAQALRAEFSSSNGGPIEQTGSEREFGGGSVKQGAVGTVAGGVGGHYAKKGLSKVAGKIPYVGAAVRALPWLGAAAGAVGGAIRGSEEVPQFGVKKGGGKVRTDFSDRVNKIVQGETPQDTADNQNFAAIQRFDKDGTGSLPPGRYKATKDGRSVTINIGSPKSLEQLRASGYVLE